MSTVSTATATATVPVTMPQLGETVTEGTVTRWLKNVGEAVTENEPIVEISTDKVDTEVVAPATGTVLEILVREDSTVEVGALLAVIGHGGTQTAVAGTGSSAERRPRHRHSPKVRRLARDSGIDLDGVAGTGPNGRVTVEDLTRAGATDTPAQSADVAMPAIVPSRPAPVPDPAATSAYSPSAPAPAAAMGPPPTSRGSRTEPMSRVRSIIAERMMTSLHTTAQLTTVVESDVSAVIVLRERLSGSSRQSTTGKVSLSAFFAKAAVDALRRHPLLNASIGPDGQDVTIFETVGLGIAVDTPRGLVVPVVKGAEDLNVLGLSTRIADLAARARDGSLGADDLAGGTFTITNTGSRGALFDTPILVPGQVGILGVGGVVERPVVQTHPDGTRGIAIRHMSYLALTYDHRLVDGADAARFLVTVKDLLEAGQFDLQTS